MTTVAQLTERIRRQIRGVVPVGQFTTLNEALDTSETGVDVVAAADYHNLVDGAVIEIDQELMLVTAVSTNTLTVIRGFDGTDAVAHDTGTQVFINPRYSAMALIEHMKSEVASWEPHIYRAVTITEEWPALTATLELSSTPIDGCSDQDVYGVLSCFRVPTETNQAHRPMDVSITREHGGPNGNIYLNLRNAWTYGSAADVRITLAASYDISDWPGEEYAGTTTAWDTEVTLRRGLQDLLTWGTGVRVLSGLVLNRADLARQGQARHADEVGAQELELAVQLWSTRREAAFAQEHRRLQQLYPLHRVG